MRQSQCSPSLSSHSVAKAALLVARDGTEGVSLTALFLFLIPGSVLISHFHMSVSWLGGVNTDRQAAFGLDLKEQQEYFRNTIAVC